MREKLKMSVCSSQIVHLSGDEFTLQSHYLSQRVIFSHFQNTVSHDLDFEWSHFLAQLKSLKQKTAHHDVFKQQYI